MMNHQKEKGKHPMQVVQISVSPSLGEAMQAKCKQFMVGLTQRVSEGLGPDEAKSEKAKFIEQ
eukprot:3853284-Alexandrium_andersonii.AAC.1